MKVSTFIDLTITKPQLFWSSQCQEIKTEKNRVYFKTTNVDQSTAKCYRSQKKRNKDLDPQ